MSKVQTDNSYLAAKVELRAEHLPSGPVRVLDCYAGTGRIWREVRRRCPQRRIRVTGIDTRRLPGIYLRGDNRKFLGAMDLEPFNVIDLDAYGVPFQQMDILFGRRRGTAKTVFVTFIQTVMGRLPDGLLRALGYTDSMCRKCPTLLCRDGLAKIKAYLSIRGVTEIVRYSSGDGRKYYLSFTLEPNA